MAAGSEPEHIKRLFGLLSPYCIGLSLCGAGAGGYAVAILKADARVSDIAAVVDGINRSIVDDDGDVHNHDVHSHDVHSHDGGQESHCCQQVVSLHTVTVDDVGLHAALYRVDAQGSAPLSTAELRRHILLR